MARKRDSHALPKVCKEGSGTGPPNVPAVTQTLWGYDRKAMHSRSVPQTHTELRGPCANIPGIPPQRFQILGAAPFLRPLVWSACLGLVSKFPIFSTLVDPMPGTKEVLTHQTVRGLMKERR